ncbi:MAG: TolC family outer membrane protein [Gammaproteobacteria bacterium]
MCGSTVCKADRIDLLDAYALIVNYSPEWASQRAQYVAKLQAIPLARSQLLPQIGAEIGWSRVDYSGRNVDFNLNIDRINACTQGITLNGPSSLNIGTALDRLECLFTSDTEPFTSTTYGVRLSQPLFRMDRWHQLRRSKSAVNRASAELHQAKQDLILSTATTYFNVLNAKEALIVSENEQNALEYSLRLIEKRYERGLAKSAQVYETQAQHDLSLASLLTAENIAADTRSALALMTRTDGVDTTDLPRNIPLKLPQPEDPKDWVLVAQKNSPELAIARHSATMAYDNYRAQKAARIPAIDLFVNVNRTSAGGATPALDEGQNTNTTIGVSMSVPIYTGGGIKANTKQALYQRQAARWTVNKIEHELVQQVQAQYRKVRLAVSQGQAHALAVRSTQQAYEAIQRGYKAGTRTLNDLLQAQRSVYLAQRDAASARYNYVLETLRLKRIVGILDESDLRTLNQWLPPLSDEERIDLANLPNQDDTLPPTTMTIPSGQVVKSSRSFLELFRLWINSEAEPSP